MTVHVNIGEAKTRLSQLVAAALRGEEVVLDRNGKPQVKLVPVEALREEDRARRAAKRRAAFGMFTEAFREWSDEGVGPAMTDAEVEERWDRKFGPAA